MKDKECIILQGSHKEVMHLDHIKMHYCYKYKWMNKYLPRRFIKLPGYTGIEFLGKEFFVRKMRTYE